MAEMMTLTEAQSERARLERQLKVIRAYIRVLKAQREDTPEEPEVEA